MMNQIIKKEINEIILQSEYSKEAFEYGFKVLCLNVCTILSIILVSKIAYNDIKIGFIFILFFTPLRITLGGYHCKSPIRCIVTFSLLFYILLSIYKNIGFQHYLDYILIIITCIYLLFMSNENVDFAHYFVLIYIFLGNLFCLISESHISYMLELTVIFNIILYFWKYIDDRVDCD